MPAPKGHPPYNTNGEGGKPTIHTKEFIEKLADDLEKWIKNGKFLWFERFAIQNDLNPDLMKVFAEKNERFNGVYEQAKAYQRVILYEGGLLKKFQYNMCQLILGNSYGIFDKKEADDEDKKFDEMAGKFFDLLKETREKDDKE